MDILSKHLIVPLKQGTLPSKRYVHAAFIQINIMIIFCLILLTETNPRFLFLKELPSDQGKQLILAVSKLINREKAAEREKIRLLSQLCIANDEAKDVALEIEEANAKEMAYKLKLLMTSHPSEDELFIILPHAEILRQVDDVKNQIYSLKLDMASALEQKAKAHMVIEFSNAEYQSYSRYSEELAREIEAARVEQEFFDLARIESERELQYLEAQREAESACFNRSMERAKARIVDLRKEITSVEKMQTEVMITASDGNSMQNEMEFIRAMESFEKTCLVDGTHNPLQSAKSELEAAKKQLSSLKEEGFMLMAEMDAKRKELIQVALGKEQSLKTNKNSESRLENVNAQLHNAMAKMESASLAEKRAGAIVTTLSDALQQVQSDIDAAKREADLIRGEARAIRMETERTKLHTRSVKEKFEEAMKLLAKLKASEAKALEELNAVTESTMSDRAIASLWSSTINISKFEYYYLTKQAEASREVADKKVAAAQAWMEALKAENREKRMKAEENWAIVAVEEKNLSKPKKAAALICRKKAMKNELKNHEQEQEEAYNLQTHDMVKLAIAMPRRSLTVSGVTGPASRRVNARGSTNSLRRRPSFPSTSPKKGKLVENIVKFLKG
ncbi:protein PLASTID MOVEMENT IMPAIRED 2-like [Canna indica]|uniref:Protein PLASTID MOVEMENT IMPAIRED 2-like n=1 Tax=Canna indica TaxID=4628 RepID=A0AAQ3QK49_9LILI|nr:protein PLASTID MOVEMENT IMPAIRED 2-like [Canna indica]